jgi:hypothetical protein
MWNGKTFPLSPSTENNLKAVLIKRQAHLNNYQNNINIKFIEHAKVNSNNSNSRHNKKSDTTNGNSNNSSNNKKCADRIAIDMEVFMQKKCIAHHTA